MFKFFSAVDGAQVRDGALRRASVTSHSIRLAGRKTSISLEDEFWDDLHSIALDRRISLSELIAEIDASRGDRNRSSAIRIHVLRHYRSLQQAQLVTFAMQRGSVAVR